MTSLLATDTGGFDTSVFTQSVLGACLLAVALTLRYLYLKRERERDAYEAELREENGRLREAVAAVDAARDEERRNTIAAQQAVIDTLREQGRRGGSGGGR